jgi:hypothetical protein
MSDSDPLFSAATLAFRRGFGAVLKVEPQGRAPFFVDGRGEAARLSPTPLDAAPACVWRADAETLLRIFEGGRALEGAFLSGRLRIAGDMSVMARLQMESVR